MDIDDNPIRLVIPVNTVCRPCYIFRALASEIAARPFRGDDLLNVILTSSNIPPQLQYISRRDGT